MLTILISLAIFVILNPYAIMNKLVFIFFLSLLSTPLFATTNELDSLLQVLDETIKIRQTYTLDRQSKIDSLNKKLEKSQSLDNDFQIYENLFSQYRSYNMDSALHIANQRLAISEKMKNDVYINSSRMNIAEILGVMGMYKEALDIMNSINRKELNHKQESYYLHNYHSLYIVMYENSIPLTEKKIYQEKIQLYKDSSLVTKKENSLSYKLITNSKLVYEKRYDEALKIMLDCYDEYKNNDGIIATVAYGISEIYGKKGDSINQQKYLAISAIKDLQRGVKEYIALQELAIILYKKGDVDRAYSYIKCAMEDATFCKARFRTLGMSETLPIIVSSYDNKVKKEKESLIKYLILISVLSFVLISSIIYIYMQMKKLSNARKSISKMYDDMKIMNDELNHLNKQLSESDQVKEEYIGYIFNLCSTYIDKMETYRININRKLKAGQIDDAIKTTSSTSLVADELKEFFRNFDAIFLNIYPNFVDDFNSLLIDDEKIIVKSGDILTPELRVFALTRLGISDSSKIASFLHYSPQTVYNYKLKVRNKIKISKEEFAIKIQQIGK